MDVAHANKVYNGLFIVKKELYRSIKSCSKALANAQNYDHWLVAASEYDELHQYDSWRHQDESPFYPHALLTEQINNLQDYRQHGQVNLLLPYLQESLHRTLGELTDTNLYNVSMVGTKHLIERYLNEIEASLDYLCDTDFDFIDHTQKKILLKHARKNFGRTALMLSGGGAFGIYHFGIVKALLQHQLLPDVISGTSMGAIVAGVIGTHSDEDLLAKLAEPEKNHFRPLSLRSFGGMTANRTLLDPDQLIDCISANIPDDTFLEAYQRTGRVINITVSPTRSGQKPRILNYKTAPHVLISYSCKASCSIPGVFPPVQLMKKNTLGEIVPYMESELWADGGVSTDIPMGRMGRLHNANHFIVSQTNPHVLPFVANKNRSGIAPFLFDLASSTIHAQWHQVISVSKKRVHNRKARFWLDRADALLGQDYLGDINLHPDFPIQQYFKVMANPSDSEVHDYILAGERATWPKLAMIRNQTRISRALKRCQERLDRQNR